MLTTAPPHAAAEEELFDRAEADAGGQRTVRSGYGGSGRSDMASPRRIALSSGPCFGYNPAIPIELTSRVQPTSGDFVDASVDGERFHSLRDTGLRVWQLLGQDDGGVTVGAVVTALCEEFEVDADTCLKDVSVP